MTRDEIEADACGLYALLSVISLVAMSNMRYLNRKNENGLKFRWFKNIRVSSAQEIPRIYLPRDYFLEYKIIFEKIVKTILIVVVQRSMCEYVWGSSLNGVFQGAFVINGERTKITIILSLLRPT